MKFSGNTSIIVHLARWHLHNFRSLLRTKVKLIWSWYLVWEYLFVLDKRQEEGEVFVYVVLRYFALLGRDTYWKMLIVQICTISIFLVGLWIFLIIHSFLQIDTTMTTFNLKLIRLLKSEPIFFCNRIMFQYCDISGALTK